MASQNRRLKSTDQKSVIAMFKPEDILLGTPSAGKTALMLQMINDLLKNQAAVIVMNPKGSFGRKFRDLIVKGGGNEFYQEETSTDKEDPTG